MRKSEKKSQVREEEGLINIKWEKKWDSSNFCEWANVRGSELALTFIPVKKSEKIREKKERKNLGEKENNENGDNVMLLKCEKVR